jgi:hypothetical protein
LRWRWRCPPFFPPSSSSPLYYCWCRCKGWILSFSPLLCPKDFLHYLGKLLCFWKRKMFDLIFSLFLNVFYFIVFFSCFDHFFFLISLQFFLCVSLFVGYTHMSRLCFFHFLCLKFECRNQHLNFCLTVLFHFYQDVDYFAFLCPVILSGLNVFFDWWF